LLNFVGNAIELSGETGTKLKSEIISAYYKLWWTITSGGASKNYRYTTTIVEMNAATGENFLSDSKAIILGSSGHAIELKNNPDTSNLIIILIEENSKCYSRLKNVIKERWPTIRTSENLDIEGDVYLSNTTVTYAVSFLNDYRLGNSLYFFDPLLYTPWHDIERVAGRRITKHYRTGTEFIIFLFTSDWFYGRNEKKPLPEHNISSKWKEDEEKIVVEMDDLFGNISWRDKILTQKHPEERMDDLVNWYKLRLHKWFRYVLPLPFQPKKNQTYHLFMCSNYERGIKIPQGFYNKLTGNKQYEPDFKRALTKFKLLHPELLRNPKDVPKEWRILRAVIKNHEEGICDKFCADLLEIEANKKILQNILERLREEKYIKDVNFVINFWRGTTPVYDIDWNVVKEKLNIEKPSILRPVTSVEKLTQKKEQGKLDDWF